MSSSCLTGCILFLLLLASGGKGATEASGEGGLDPGCTRLSDTSYTLLHQTGQELTLICPKQCSNDTPIWYHTLDPNIAATATHYGPELVLPFTKPPKRNNVGYFCCACAGKHPKYASCCFGVGYSPEVYSFRTTRKKTEVEGLYVGQTVKMKCAVYGYPGKDTNAEIVGPSGITETCDPIHGLYESECAVEITRVTVGHSGLYTCRGVLTIIQAGETGQEISDDVLQKELFVYEPPSIIRLRQEDSADDESVTFVCAVECSIDFHITWLHNGTKLNITEDGKYRTFNSGSNQHKLKVSLTSTSDVGGYTCVINTAFKQNESAKTIGFRSTPQVLRNLEDLPGPLGEQEPTSGITSVVVLSVCFVFIFIAVICIGILCIGILMQKIRGSKRRDDEVHVLLQPIQTVEGGEDDSTDGPSHRRREEIERREVFRSVEVKGPAAPVRLRRQPL